MIIGRQFKQMKHLLSILIFLSFMSLIFVSCSKSPEQYLENCADTRFIDSREENIAILEEPNDYPYTSEAKIQSYKRDISFVKSKSLQKKLQKEDYEMPKYMFEWERRDAYTMVFERCSNELRENEVLFKAKWK